MNTKLSESIKIIRILPKLLSNSTISHVYPIFSLKYHYTSSTLSEPLRKSALSTSKTHQNSSIIALCGSAKDKPYRLDYRYAILYIGTSIYRKISTFRLFINGRRALRSMIELFLSYLFICLPRVNLSSGAYSAKKKLTER